MTILKKIVTKHPDGREMIFKLFELEDEATRTLITTKTSKTPGMPVFVKNEKKDYTADQRGTAYFKFGMAIGEAENAGFKRVSIIENDRNKY